MHVRILNFRGATDIDAGVTFLREKVLPVLSQQKGYRGLTASADRSSGVLGVLTLWDTPGDREASFEALASLRKEGERVIGSEPEVETFEEMVVEVGSTPPAPGAALMITRTSMDPAKVDENLAFFKAEIVPQLKAQPGFRALRNMIDRQTGRGIVGTVWSDQAALKAAAEQARARREQGVARGVTFTDDSIREIVLVELS